MNELELEDFSDFLDRGKRRGIDTKKLIVAWFIDNPQEPIVVGLSDEQCDIFGSMIDDEEGTDYVGKYLKEWQKTQTFAQPQQQQLEPNWGDAPKSATEFTLTGNWYNENGMRLSGYHITKEQRPKPPEPTVEVGQVWKMRNSFFELKIINVNDDAITGKCFEDSAFECSASDFMVNFERIA